MHGADIRTMPLNAKPPVEKTTSRRRLRDPGLKIRGRDAKSPENETYQKSFRDFKIGPKFSETHVFPGTILYSLIRSSEKLVILLSRFINESLICLFKFLTTVLFSDH